MVLVWGPKVHFRGVGVWGLGVGWGCDTPGVGGVLTGWAGGRNVFTYPKGAESRRASRPHVGPGFMAFSACRSDWSLVCWGPKLVLLSGWFVLVEVVGCFGVLRRAWNGLLALI